MNRNYDLQLNQIPFYQLHPELLPFIGDYYEKYKLLIIGESHYIGQTPENELYNIEYFMKNWWDPQEPSPGYNQWIDWFNTRKVLCGYLSGQRSKGHLIFTNLVKAFSEKQLNKPIKHISIENSQTFHYFAFMNFFQMPSLFDGWKYWDSISASAKKLNNARIALDAWTKCSQESAFVLDRVVEILNPNAVIFSSKSAYYAYLEVNKSSNKVYCVPHAGSAYWNKPTKNSNGKTGKELFFDCLEKIDR